MPSTHVSLHYHIVFSTKARARSIADTWVQDLHSYIGGIFCDIEAVPECIGGTGDHVHALVGLRATQTVADIVREVKRGSSAWIHRQGVKSFLWQEGYGAFTVSPSQLSKVRRYIENQVEHHRRQTFEEEYVELLRLSGVEHDERFLW